MVLGRCAMQLELSLLAMVMVVVLLIMMQNRRKRSLAAPPGPPALPIIGHMHLLAASTYPAHALALLSKRYGPLLSLKLGSVPFIVASTPDAARQILQTHDQVFAFRAPLATVKAVYGDSTGIIFTDPGPCLRFLRALCASDLFNPRRLQIFKPIRDEEVGLLLQSIFHDVNECAENATIGSARPVLLRPHIQAAANNIISRMVIGDKTHTVLPLILRVTDAMSAVNLGDFFPWIQWADLQGCVKHAKKAGLEAHAALQDIMDRRRAERAGSNGLVVDMLDVLLTASSTCSPDVQIKDAHIRAALLDIFGGASDTSAVLIEWVMTELLANITKLNAAEEEIACVLSSKSNNEQTIEEDDIQNMPYLRSVVKETMRLHPVLPLLIPKESRKPCVIFGYKIPAKTQVFVNTWAIGRDPQVWDNPNEFLPERFLENNVDVRGQHFELLPFGSGRRVCPGQNLGLLNVHIIVARLLHSFSWRPHDLEHDMSEKVAFIGYKAKPLLAFATPKLPIECYMG